MTYSGVKLFGFQLNKEVNGTWKKQWIIQRISVECEIGVVFIIKWIQTLFFIHIHLISFLLGDFSGQSIDVKVFNKYL